MMLLLDIASRFGFHLCLIKPIFCGIWTLNMQLNWVKAKIYTCVSLWHELLCTCHFSWNTSCMKYPYCQYIGSFHKVNKVDFSSLKWMWVVKMCILVVDAQRLCSVQWRLTQLKLISITLIYNQIIVWFRVSGWWGATAMDLPTCSPLCYLVNAWECVVWKSTRSWMWQVLLLNGCPESCCRGSRHSSMFFTQDCGSGCHATWLGDIMWLGF